VKRATEVAKEVVATYKARSVDVGKLPDGVTMESIEEHFASHGKVLSVRLLVRQGSM
jgi:RNA recognition motif-containing protein